MGGSYVQAGVWGWQLSLGVYDPDSEPRVPAEHHHHCRGCHRPQREAHLVPLCEGREYGAPQKTCVTWMGSLPFICSPQGLLLGPSGDLPHPQ